MNKNQREIKFRVWNTDKKKMVIRKPKTPSYFFEQDIFGWAAQGMKLIFQQFTGLKDKNGKEIYEGDIVQFYYGFDGTDWIYNEVKFGEMRDCRWGYYINGHSCLSSKVEFEKSEIIGNIFENPELLKA